MMSKKIAVLMTDQFEDIEYTSPAEAFKEAGHSVVTIDLEAGKEVTGKHGEKVKIDQAISDADPKEFDALLIPGGFSPDLLRGDAARVNSLNHSWKIRNPFSRSATARSC